MGDQWTDIQTNRRMDGMIKKKKNVSVTFSMTNLKNHLCFIENDDYETEMIRLSMKLK